jgi:hypothetical protein
VNECDFVAFRVFAPHSKIRPRGQTNRNEGAPYRALLITKNKVNNQNYILMTSFVFSCCWQFLMDCIEVEGTGDNSVAIEKDRCDDPEKVMEPEVDQLPGKYRCKIFSAFGSTRKSFNSYRQQEHATIRVRFDFLCYATFDC